MHKLMIAAALGMITPMLWGTQISLNGEWKLEYFEQPERAPIRDLPLPPTLQVASVKATVPGNCELDLCNAGILPPAEIGLNSLKYHAYEGHQWLYTRKFTKPAVKPSDTLVLRFEGVDTLADYFLNGKKIGSSENMHIAHEFDITDIVAEGENTLQVLLRSVVMASRDTYIAEGAGGTACANFRKACYMGGWDIFARLYVAGLWREVVLDVRDECRIENSVWIVKGLNKRSAAVNTMARIRAPFKRLYHGFVRVSVSKDGQLCDANMMPFNDFQLSTSWGVKNIEWWWPNGMGEHPLYEAKIELMDQNHQVLASDVRRIGFRTIELVHESVYSKERPGNFLLKVNGEPCYVRGSNWVPLDSFPSRQAAKIVPTLEKFIDLNCNMVRVWGGGVYEPDAFFDYCDEHGLMVWQDFMTACDYFPQNDEYAKLTDTEVRQIVLKYRNRASLVLWSGNNENDSAGAWRLGKMFRIDPNHDRNSRRTIPDAIRECDVTRPYVPSSPYEPPEVIKGLAKPAEMHLWGVRNYYKVPEYTNSPCWFASEMGYHGATSLVSLKKMMTPECLYPWKGGEKGFIKDNGKMDFRAGIAELDWNDEWRLKAHNCFVSRKSGLWTRNNLMTNQVRLMFGGVDTEMETFIEQSQIVQAEAMKTFVERFRSDKFRRKNGLIWWNVQDGCAQLSDAVVDYYGEKKKAYWAIRKVQQNQMVCVRDDHRVVAVNDRLHPVKGHVKIVDKASGKVLMDADYAVAKNALADLGEVPFAGQGVLKLEWTCDGERGENHFLYGAIPFNWQQLKPLLAGEYE